MKVIIEFDVDVADLTESAIEDMLADWTYEIRSSRRLVRWSIDTQ